jgi:hypothetical protein
VDVSKAGTKRSTSTASPIRIRIPPPTTAPIPGRPGLASGVGVVEPSAWATGCPSGPIQLPSGGGAPDAAAPVVG